MTKKLLGVVVIGMLVLAVGCARQGSTTAKSASGLQKIHFDFDASNIKSEFEPVLQGNAQWMKSNSKADVVIEGHCDERGTEEYNIALGDRRANAAKKYMQNLGSDAKNMSTISYGEEKPTAACHDESCWWQNRRAEFLKNK